MKTFSNPLVLSMVGLLLVAVFAWIVGVLIMRRMRQSVAKEMTGADRPAAGTGEGFALAAYPGVIQQLREQEKEIENLRRRERERVSASANISEAVLSNLSSGVLLFNPAGMVQQANPSARSILGYASPYGLHARDLFRGVTSIRKEGGEPAGSLPEAIALAQRTGGAVRRIEADYSTPAGEKRLLGITLSPVRGPQGEPLGTTCLVSDLTEISELSRQMRQQEKMAALGEMSAGIAHEFKNSLATISGYAQMLAAESDADTVRRFAERISAETLNLTRVVTDFLNFARPLHLQRESVDARVLLEDCAREGEVDLDLSAVPATCMLQGDATALRQAFSNLLRNSAEAGRNGARVRVMVSATQDDKGLRLMFRDTGSGIPEADLPRIFIPFFTTKAQGTGLGLALVHRIVSEHGGTVEAASDASGATFTLTFPQQKTG